MDQAAPFDQVAAADIGYIRRHWAVLAAEAWQGYVRHGRGILLIDRIPGQTPCIVYRTQISSRSVCESGWLSATTVRQIQQYDPRREFVCIMLHDDTTVTTYRLSAATLSPPDAYAHLCLLPQPPIA
jgi:hypothetical protein